VVCTTMAKYFKVFVQNCLQCVATFLGDKVPRPLDTQLHETKPNEILHFDFMYIGFHQHLLLVQDYLERITMACAVSLG
jgi:hypothetical protein